VFDISFSELLVIAVVALVVIGPEKLPKVARTAGAFFGRLQRFVTQVKEEVNRETRFAELQTLQQEVQSGLQQTYDDIEHSILPGEPAVDAVVDAEVASTAKKPRKPRQGKMTVADEAAATATATATAEQPVLDADPQAELFAVADSQKKPRRPRHTAKKAAAAVSDAEQNPLA
jgi:sec-independent protein translocase protein TatB